MYFTINKQDYILTFLHSDMQVEDFGSRMVTIGELNMYDKQTKEKNPLMTGFAICNPQDRFSKSVGRKIAVRRILEDMGMFTKEDRAEFWKQFFTQTNEHQKHGN